MTIFAVLPTMTIREDSRTDLRNLFTVWSCCKNVFFSMLIILQYFSIQLINHNYTIRKLMFCMTTSMMFA